MIGICLLGFLLSLMLCYQMDGSGEQRTEDNSLKRVSFRVFAEDTGYTVKVWEKEPGMYCVFLPSCAALSEIHLEGNPQSCLEFAGKTFHAGDKLEGISLDQEYKVSFYNAGVRTEGVLVFMAAKNLPMIYINMRSGSLEMVDSDKEYKESGYIRVVSANGKELYAGGIKKLTGRGNTSWEVPKKSYAVELDNTASIFGMRERKRWILTANYYDGSYLRNWLGFQIAKASGLRGAVNGVFADLYIDGEYRGLYQLTERIEAEPGYLMEIDYPERALEEENVLYLKNGQPIVLHSPEKVVQGQKDMLEERFVQIEETLSAPNYIYEETGKNIFDFLDKPDCVIHMAWRYGGYEPVSLLVRRRR